jgi:HEPN domain-containing protein
MDNKDVAKNWFKKGNSDLVAAEYLLTMKTPPTDVICFHSQLAAEKYIKAFLALQGKEIPRIHDLEELVSICNEINHGFSELYDISSELSGYAVEVRYPLENDYEITLEDAKLAIKNATEVKDFVLGLTKLD